MELNEKEEGVPLRGKSLPLKIGEESDYDTLLEAALKKHHDYDKTSIVNVLTNSSIQMNNLLKWFQVLSNVLP